MPAFSATGSLETGPICFPVPLLLGNAVPCTGTVKAPLEEGCSLPFSLVKFFFQGSGTAWPSHAGQPVSRAVHGPTPHSEWFPSLTTCTIPIVERSSCSLRLQMQGVWGGDAFSMTGMLGSLL